nr:MULTISPECIES: hypothetical protein [unclassified Microcoleus]
MVIGYSLFVIRYWLLVIRYSLFVIRYWLPITSHARCPMLLGPMPDARCPLCPMPHAPCPHAPMPCLADAPCPHARCPVWPMPSNHVLSEYFAGN